MDPTLDPERRRETRSPAQLQLIRALYALKEDATFAYTRSLSCGPTLDLSALGRSWTNVEAATQALDRERPTRQIREDHEDETQA